MVKSRYSPLDIPELPVHQLVFAMIGMYGDKVCAIDALTGHQITFEELKETAQRIASGLVRLGVKKGDVIAFLAPNSVDHLCMYHGSLASGATITSINPVYTPFEISRQIKDSGAKYIFTVEHLAKTAKQVKEQCPQLREIIVTAHIAGCVPFKRLTMDDGEAYPADMVFNVKEDIALLPYSSGTTGMPKGVMLTHYNIVANMLQISHPDAKEKVLDPEASDEMRTVMGIAPFYHAYGLLAMLCLAVAGGARLVILPRFTPQTFLHAIQKYKVRFLPVSPPLVLFLAKSPLVKQYNLSSVKAINSGAAPLAIDTAKQVKKDFKLDFIKQAYGMTETTCAATISPAGILIPGSVGRVMANSEIEIRDVESGRVLGPHERGELYVRGPNVMRGYLNRPQETQEALDKNGWLRTGDIGYYDDDENFYVVDRIKELIKVKGLQVAPAELESILLNHADIVDSAVIGIPDQRAGELPRAYLVKRPGAKVNEQQIQQYVQKLVSRHKWLQGGVEFLPEIPKSENGKILRRLLKTKALQEMKKSKL